MAGYILGSITGMVIWKGDLLYQRTRVDNAEEQYLHIGVAVNWGNVGFKKFFSLEEHRGF